MRCGRSDRHTHAAIPAQSTGSMNLFCYSLSRATFASKAADEPTVGECLRRYVLNALFIASLVLIPLGSFEAGSIVVGLNKVTDEGEQILDDISSLADHHNFTQFDMTGIEFNRFPVFHQESSISGIQIAQKYLPALNAYLGMLFTGNR